MRTLHSVLLFALSVASVRLLAGSALGSGTARARPLETITVSNTSSKPIFSSTVLDADHRYQLDASGTISDWCPATATKAADCSLGSPFEVGKGVDALYCYAKWRCPKPELWRQLLVNGRGLDQIAGKDGEIRYSASHRYSVVVEGISGRLKLATADGSTSDNSGAFSVELQDLGPVAVRVRFIVRASGRPNIEIRGGSPASLVSSKVTGSGHATFTKKKGGLLEATETKGSIVHEDTFADGTKRRLVLGIISGTLYARETRRLALVLRVKESNDPACPAGDRAATLFLLPTHSNVRDIAIFAGVPYTKSIEADTGFFGLKVKTTTGPCRGHAHGWEGGSVGASVRVITAEVPVPG